MLYIIIFYIFILSKTFYASTTSNSMQSSWEDLGQIEGFDNIDEFEIKIIENQNKKIVSSEKLIEEIRTIYDEYNCAFHQKLNKKNDDDDDSGYLFLSEEAKLSFLSKKIKTAEKNLNILLNILHSPKNIVIPREVSEKENIDSINNHFSSIQENTLYDILISAEQINCDIISRYQKNIFPCRSNKSSLSASPNTNKNNLTCKKNDGTRIKALVTNYFTSYESTPQEDTSFNTPQNSCLIPTSKNKTSCPNLPLERNQTAIFKNPQSVSPCLRSCYLSCEFIDGKIITITQNNNKKDESYHDNDKSDDDSNDSLGLNNNA